MKPNGPRELRDQIAMHALSAMNPLRFKNEPESCAADAYKVADAMLVERQKGGAA